ncbi:hypothetical protein, partial [[Kitasatospora] papulosa]|uniref:hypothetical protein n=1 Tax=[Kitasatospora] papulosa TaxID=1464011 RepID=UPI00368F190D
MVQLFLSFSGEDNSNGLVSDFFNDLCTEIGHITALAPDRLGYNYLDMRTAMRWRRELSEALVGLCYVSGQGAFLVVSCWYESERTRPVSGPV